MAENCETKYGNPVVLDSVACVFVRIFEMLYPEAMSFYVSLYTCINFPFFHSTMLEMIKKREKCKKELLQLTLEILDKRYEMEDFSGSNLAHAEAQKAPRPVFYPLYEQYAKVGLAYAYVCSSRPVVMLINTENVYS